MLKILPIGGINEIGMNQYLLVYEDTSILVDSGLGFPRDSYLGIEAVVPDYKQIFKMFPDINKVFISHAHEDHIGSLVYLLEEKKIKIIAPPYAAKLIEHKCLNIYNKKINIQVAEEGVKYTEGFFTIEYLWTNHSIPDTASLFIKTPEHNILFSSDFKLTGKIDFIKKIKNLIKKNGPINILLCDSTNATESGYSEDDEKVEQGLDAIFKKSKGKIVVTLFSSHIDRINMLIKLAKKNKRFLFLSGLNLSLHTNIAKSLNYLEDTKGVLLDYIDFKKTPNNKIVLLCTGSQGEENSSISKLSRDRHPFTNIDKDDSIIFSSSTIPGNERDILNTVNSFIEKNANVYTDSRSIVHATGHACAAELKEFIENVKPDIFIPIHGEAIHLKANIDIAKACKVKKTLSLKRDNFLIIDSKKNYYEPIDSINKLFVDRATRLLVDKTIVKERKKLCSNGLLMISLVIKTKVLIKVNIDNIGVFKSKDLNKIYKNIELRIKKTFSNSSKTINNDKYIEKIKNFSKQEFRYFFKDKPEVIVNIIKI